MPASRLRNANSFRLVRTGVLCLIFIAAVYYALGAWGTKPNSGQMDSTEPHVQQDDGRVPTGLDNGGVGEMDGDRKEQAHHEEDAVIGHDDAASDEGVPASKYNVYAETKRAGCVPGSISSDQQGAGADINKHLFRDEPFGVFVEFGAGDGLFMSNSHPYEEELCWSGLCIEPTTEFEKLQRNRPKCAKVKSAICDRDGPRTFHDITENGLWTGWSGFGDTFEPTTWRHINNNVARGNWRVKEIEVQCVKLQNLLSSKGVPKVDYLAIDVQGAEYEVLRTIDFKSVTVDVLQVESMAQEGGLKIESLMVGNGFVKVAQVGEDSIYVRKGPDGKPVREWIE
uniref:Methyltransferase FkbM domain-containing protein n=1 Tax=Pyramimonas obovata TaxID=1411642 RepID=A0A7S0RCF0_9CHLO|mmetsp:Transcript_3097/g.6447  ORF Transcript_3097/g.6447 Transcript_3097/m.6447 type:complete len:340 (+) Transcript_3097:133-1152(+)